MDVRRVTRPPNAYMHSTWNRRAKPVVKLRWQLSLSFYNLCLQPRPYNADMTWKIVFIAVVTRVLIALATQTFFQPDEYYQSLEVAHHLVFGYGHITWEWLTQKPIRSIIYPLLNVPVYSILKYSGLDNTRLLVGTCSQLLRCQSRMTNSMHTDLGT